MKLFEILRYIFTPCDSKCSTVTQKYEQLDLKYGLFKTLFWLIISILGVILIF